MAVIHMAKDFSQAIFDQLVAKHGEPDEKNTVWYITGDGWGPEFFMGAWKEKEEKRRMENEERWKYATKHPAYIWYAYDRERTRDSDLLTMYFFGEISDQSRAGYRKRLEARGYTLDG
jgi:hypothetical protein